ncbi:hypothetical protein IMY05_016G0039700 [Salix suchowensis]|nr:hypothetical protein IMY05_016G0039700 [Salix suchowensis]
MLTHSKILYLDQLLATNFRHMIHSSRTQTLPGPTLTPLKLSSCSFKTTEPQASTFPIFFINRLSCKIKVTMLDQWRSLLYRVRDQ